MKRIIEEIVKIENKVEQLKLFWYGHWNIERGVQPEDGEGSEKGRLRSEIKQEFTC